MHSAEDYIKWFWKKFKLEQAFNRNILRNWFVKRKSIYTCYLGENIGDEKGKLDSRPVLVVSADHINRSNSNVVVVPLSKNIKWKDPIKKVLRYDYHYVLYKRKYNKLTHDSAVQCEDIRVVSKKRLGDLIEEIDNNDMKEIRKRLRRVLQF